MASYVMGEEEDEVEQKEVDEEEDEADGQYEVEKITGKKTIKGKVVYLVKWVGYPSDESTWEPVANLTSSKDMILEFEEREKSAKQSKHAASGSRSGPRNGDEDSMLSGSRSTDRKNSSAGSRSRMPATKGKRADGSHGSDDEEQEKMPTKRTRAAEVVPSRSDGRSRSGRGVAGRGLQRDDDDGDDVDEQKYATVEDGDDDRDFGDTEGVKATSRRTTATTSRSTARSTASAKQQQSGQKSSTMADEIFPQGNDRTATKSSGRQVTGKPSGTKPITNGGGVNNKGNGLRQAREEIQKFAKAPVYANLTEAKSGKVDMKDLTVRGMFMSSEEEHFALLTGRRGAGNESVEFYVGARSLAASSEDLARQMVQTLAQSIQVVLPSR